MPPVLPGRDGALPELPNHPAPSTPNILGHQGHHTGTKLLRWHLLDWGAGQENSAWLGWGAPGTVRHECPGHRRGGDREDRQEAAAPTSVLMI